MVSSNKSADLFVRAQKVLPGGVSRNTIFRLPHPLYADFAKGCYVTDIDGEKRLDFANNMASLIHGHAHPVVTQAIIEQVQKGSAYTLGTELEVQYAELLCKRVPSFERLRFVNSGTEAVMAMIKTARAFTSKAKIAKVEGAYHGAYDYAEVSQTATPHNWGDEDSPNSTPVAVGTPESALDDVIIIPYNDVEKAIKILDQYKDEIAAILLDPVSHRVGMVPATADFVDALYQWSRQHNALLMFDEVITFRAAYGGAQENYRIKPDLTALGKMIGGGFPVGAIAGRKDVMEVLNPMQNKVPLPHSGTFSANPVTMIAGLTSMQLFDQEAVNKLNQLGDYTRLEIANLIANKSIKVCVTGIGSMFRLHFKETAPSNYREAYADAIEAQAVKSLIKELEEQKIILINTGSGMLSTMMDKSSIDALIQAMSRAFDLILKQYPSLKRGFKHV